MEFGLRDLIYVVVYAVGICSLWFTFKFKQDNNETEINSIKKKILTDSGLLNVVDVRTCREHRGKIEQKVDDGHDRINSVIQKIDKMDKNIMLIMYHLEIKEAELPKA